MEDLLSYLSFQPVFHNWCNKDHGMYYPIGRMVVVVDFLSHYLNDP